MQDEIKDNDIQYAGWTEIDYQPESYNPSVGTPIYFPKYAQFFRCKSDAERRTAPMSIVVFRQQGAEDWEDDAPIGAIQAQVLGDGDEELRPIDLFYLGVDPQGVARLEDQNDHTTVISFRWPFGEITIPGATKTDRGFEIDNSLLAAGQTFTAQLTVHQTGHTFQLPLSVPVIGLTIRNAQGEAVSGALDIPFEEIMDYTYEYKGNEKNDRFAISFNNDKRIYLYILNGTRLSIRDKRDKMAKVGETDASGRLAMLLQGEAHTVIKHKDQRWRINVIS